MATAVGCDVVIAESGSADTRVHRENIAVAVSSVRYEPERPDCSTAEIRAARQLAVARWPARGDAAGVRTQVARAKAIGVGEGWQRMCTV